MRQSCARPRPSGGRGGAGRGSKRRGRGDDRDGHRSPKSTVSVLSFGVVGMPGGGGEKTVISNNELARIRSGLGGWQGGAAHRDAPHISEIWFAAGNR